MLRGLAIRLTLYLGLMRVLALSVPLASFFWDVLQPSEAFGDPSTTQSHSKTALPFVKPPPWQEEPGEEKEGEGRTKTHFLMGKL